MNLNWITCKKIDKVNYLKDRTVCKNCYNKNRRKKISHEKEACASNRQPKNDGNKNIGNNPGVSAYKNHRHVFIGPSILGKTLYILTTLEKKEQRT